MANDVTQWLAEIKALKQQLADVQQEREQAYASATNWQRLYETEAQQRRTEAHLARQTIEALRQEVQQLQNRFRGAEGEATNLAEIQVEVEQFQTVAVLREKLITALAEHDRLLEALKVEQANHAQTRKSLTTALGDAIDLLTKEQNAAGKSTEIPD